MARTASTRAPSTTRESGKTSRSTAKAAPANPSPTPEDLALHCRKQALLILAQSPSLEKDINLFWDQATKWGAVYVKAVSGELFDISLHNSLLTGMRLASSTPPSERQIAQTLSTFFSDLIAHVPPERAQGARFEALCEWWMRFAKKVCIIFRAVTNLRLLKRAGTRLKIPKRSRKSPFSFKPHLPPNVQPKTSPPPPHQSRSLHPLQTSRRPPHLDPAFWLFLTARRFHRPLKMYLPRPTRSKSSLGTRLLIGPVEICDGLRLQWPICVNHAPRVGNLVAKRTKRFQGRRSAQ